MSAQPPSDGQRPKASALAARLVEAGGGHVRAVLLYGSQLLRTRPDRHSAFDLVVLVHEYRLFYSALSASGELHRPAWLMTWMARVLPPNTLAFVPDVERQHWSEPWLNGPGRVTVPDHRLPERTARVRRAGESNLPISRLPVWDLPVTVGCS